MSTPENVWRSGSTGRSPRTTWWKLWQSCLLREAPAHIRSDNRPEFVADTVRSWLGRLGVKTLFIEPGSPWENGYIESCNGKFSDELLNGEIFDTITEAKVVTERWRNTYNKIRPTQLTQLKTTGTGDFLSTSDSQCLKEKTKLRTGT